MILDKIVAVKREEVELAKRILPQRELERKAAQQPAPYDFTGALRRQGGQIRLIAEVKKASPSKGLIRANFYPLEIAQTYAAAGAAAISVLTDKSFFQGDPEYLRQIRQTVDLPLLRKDFIIDSYQIYEARTWGADAVLLIVNCLSVEKLREYLKLCRELGLAALVEVHTAQEVETALNCDAGLIGINNRNLHTFETDLQTTETLRTLLPADRVVVSESGIRDAGDVARLKANDVDAILVGESLMRPPNVAEAIKELLGKAVKG